LKISAIIPTKNRLQDLIVAFNSISKQSRPPDELIIVDQSSSPISQTIIASLRNSLPATSELNYIYNTCISGLVEAKHVGVSHASGDILCFFEDDIVLELDYIYEIELSFLNLASILGASGVVTNTPVSSPAYVFFHELFHRGLFKDPRPRVYSNIMRLNTKFLHTNLISTNLLSGGLSSWKRHVFERVPFYLRSGFHMLEDKDFSIRVCNEYGPCLFINPSARLTHNFAPAGRDSVGRREMRKTQEYFIFYMKHRKGMRDTFCFLWLLLGLLFSSGFVSLNKLSLKPVIGIFLGIINFFKSSDFPPRQ